jgi:hypothetical protein
MSTWKPFDGQTRPASSVSFISTESEVVTLAQAIPVTRKLDEKFVVYGLTDIELVPSDLPFASKASSVSVVVVACGLNAERTEDHVRQPSGVDDHVKTGKINCPGVAA